MSIFNFLKKPVQQTINPSARNKKLVLPEQKKADMSFLNLGTRATPQTEQKSLAEKTADFIKIPVTTVINAGKDLPNQLKRDSDLRKGFQRGILGVSAAISRFNTSFYGAFGDKINAAQQKNISVRDEAALQALRDVDIDINDPRKLSEKLQDPKWFYANLGEALPSTLSAIGIGLAGGALGLPVAGATALGASTGFAQVYGNAYQAATSKGLDDEAAKKIAVFTGLGSGFLEALPGWRVFNKVFGEKANAVKKSFVSNVANRIASIFKQGSLEGGTESLQTVYENAWKQTYDSNQELFEGVAESGIFGGIIGGGIDTTIQGVQAVSDLYREAEKRYLELSAGEKQAGFIKNPLVPGDDKDKPLNNFLKKKIADVIKEVPEVTTANQIEGNKPLNKRSKDNFYKDEMGSVQKADLNKFEPLRLSRQDNSTLEDVFVGNVESKIAGDNFTVYRVAPKDARLEPGDFVFDNKEMAEEFLKTYGTSRGLESILETNITKDDLSLPFDWNERTVEGEFIYNPKSKRKKIPDLSIATKAVQNLTDTDIEEMAKKVRSRTFTDEDVGMMQVQLSIMREAIEENPAARLSKYVARSGEFKGQLPEVGGTGTNEFARRGDEIAADLGFEDSEEARKAFENVKEQKERLKEMQTLYRTMRAEQVTTRKAELLVNRLKSDRRAQVRLLKDAFNLTDGELKEIRGNRDIISMTDEEFAEFMAKAEVKAEEYQIRSEARAQLLATIEQKELKKWENLQKALKLPEIRDMTTEQLREFDEILSKYERGDEFLTQRKLETIDKTDLKGSKTYREARLKLAQKLGMPIERIGNFRIGERDRFLWDSALAERNPFYNFMVQNFNASMLEGEMRYLELEAKTNELMKKARKGKKFVDKLVPTDDRIFEYLEATPGEKMNVAKVMSPDEYFAAEFFREEFNKALEYEYEQQVFKKSRFEDSYITHIRRPFLEAIKSELREQTPARAFVTAFIELLGKYKDDYAVLNILDQKTGQILPLEKFFKFAMKREDNLVPTKNVANAFLTYMKIFETKKALDRIIPELMAYVDVLTPREFTPKGLFSDGRLDTFVKEWINNKKGRRKALAIPPGGKIDGVFKALKTLVSMKFLGLKLITQLASHGGAQASTMITSGFVPYTKAWFRQLDSKYRKIAKKYEAYTGKPAWQDFKEARKGIASKANSVLYYIFKSSNYWAKKIHFLASLTPEEIESEVVTPQRLAEMNKDLGRWIPIEQAESILGSTTEGGIFTRFRKWAIVILGRVAKNLSNFPKIVKEQGKGFFKSKEWLETLRAASVAVGVYLIVRNLIEDENKEDDSFIDKLARKLLQDIGSIISALDPRTWARMPADVKFLSDFLNALGDLVRLEEYKTSGEGYKKGDLKGVNRLQNLFTPSAYRDLEDFYKMVSMDKRKGLPELPPLPKLQKLPKLNAKLGDKKLPKMPKLPKIPKITTPSSSN